MSTSRESRGIGSAATAVWESGIGPQLFRQEQDFDQAGRLVHLILTRHVGFAFRSELAFAFARIAARRVLDIGADRARVRKHAENLLIAQLSDRRTQLRRRSV